MLIKQDTIQLSEIFTSIEGEGVFVGTKTLFVRMAGCHLKCRWCDTSYALPMLSGNRYSVDYAKQLIAENLQPFTYKVNFTGGEPLVQYEAVIELAKFVRDRGLRTYLESACYDSARFAKLVPYIDICKVEFKMSDSEVVGNNYYDDLLQNEIMCLRISVDARKISYIKVVVTKSTNSGEFADLVGNIFREIAPSDICGFIIQPSSGLDEPSIYDLVRFYDIVYPHFTEVRIIPQSHKQIGAR